jgi:hypothetical protein
MHSDFQRVKQLSKKLDAVTSKLKEVLTGAKNYAENVINEATGKLYIMLCKNTRFDPLNNF